MVRLDGCAELGGVVGGEELGQGIGDEGGIAQAVVAVDIGPAHRLHQIVGAGGRVIALGIQREPRGDVEDLADRRSAGAGRRRRDDVIATVAAAHRLTLDHLVAPEILQGEDSAIGLAGRDDGLGNRPAIEGIGPVPGDELQGLRQLRLDQPVTGGEGLTLLQEDGSDIGLGPRRPWCRCARISTSGPVSVKPCSAKAMAGAMTWARVMLP